MRRYGLVAISILAVVGTITAVFAGIGSRTSGMPTLFHKHDLAEHNITLITPLDSEFDSVAARHFKKRKPETLKPFSVFIRNSGSRTLVAYLLTWKFVKNEGAVITKSMGYSEPAILMGEQMPVNSAIKHTTAIEPNSVRCFTWDSQIGPEIEGEEPRNSASNDNSGELQALLEEQLSDATSITVSIEGAVFEDGEFVGSNLIFLQQIQAVVNAKVDLLRELSEASGLNRVDEALESIRIKSEQPEVPPTEGFSPDQYYRHFQKAYAQEITGLSRAYGKDKVIPHLMKSYRRAHPVLKKPKD